MNVSEDAATLNDALAALPLNATLAWGESHMPLAPGIHSASWVDIYQPELCAALQWSWMWTINNPDTDACPEETWRPGKPADGNWNLLLPPDITVWVVFESSRFDRLPDPHVVTPLGESPTSSQYETLLDAAEGDPERVVAMPGWTTGAINTLVHAWLAAHSRPDLTLTYQDNLTSPLHAAMAEAVDAFDNGTAATYQIGEHVQASEQVMDFLLDMPPEDAADLMRQLNRVLGEGDES